MASHSSLPVPCVNSSQTFNFPRRTRKPFCHRRRAFSRGNDFYSRNLSELTSNSVLPKELERLTKEETKSNDDVLCRVTCRGCESIDTDTDRVTSENKEQVISLDSNNIGGKLSIVSLDIISELSSSNISSKSS